MQQAALTKVLNRLKDSTSIEEKCIILTYINGFEGKNLPRVLTQIQYNELCKFLVDMITNNADKQCHMDVITRTFRVVAREYKADAAVLFDYVLQIGRKKRLKYLEFLIKLDAATLAIVFMDPKTIKFLNECMQSVHSNIMKLLTPIIGNGKIQQLPFEIDTTRLTKEQLFTIQLITMIIELLQKIYNYADSDPTFKIELFHIFTLDKIVTLAYMGYTSHRRIALNLLRSAVKKDLIPYMQQNHQCAWRRFKSQLEKKYCFRISYLVKANISDWSDLWYIGIKSLDSDLQLDGELLNKLLKIEETAFKSSEVEIRKQAFQNWRFVIDTFATDLAKLATSKCVNLLCTPLIESTTRSEDVALAKIEVWWYLIVKLYRNVSTFIYQLVEPFLNFCFGPFGSSPLFSKKHNLTPAPGKRFVKTQVVAIDALLQMLVVRKEDRFLIIPNLKERAPTALSHAVFLKSYKLLIHSFGEAVIIMIDMTDDDIPNRDKLLKVLWTNLMHYTLQSSSEYQKKILKEMICVTKELINEVERSSLISEFVLNFVIMELVEVSDALVYDDTTLVDFLLKLLCCPVLNKIEERDFDDIKVLIDQAIVPNNTPAYHSSTLHFIKTVLKEMEAGISKGLKSSSISVLWCTMSELITKYMIDGQSIKEGSGTSCNFETLLSLLTFPLKYSFWENKEQMMKIVDHWKNMYQQFDLKVKTALNAAPNFITNYLTKAMEEAIARSEVYCSFIIYFIYGVIKSSNFQFTSSNRQFPPIVSLLRDVTTICISKNNEVEVELSLKSIGLFLSGVYRLNHAGKTLTYLEYLRPSLEAMLKVNTSNAIEEEILNTLEYVIIIIQDYANSLSYKFFSLYYNTILYGLCHKNAEIAARVAVILETQSEVRADVKNLLNELEREAQKNLEFADHPSKKIKRE